MAVASLQSWERIYLHGLRLVISCGTDSWWFPLKMKSRPQSILAGSEVILFPAITSESLIQELISAL